MSWPPTLLLAGCAAAVLAMTAGCTEAGSSARPLTPQASHDQACAAVPAKLVKDTQRYIDGFSVQAQPVIGPVRATSSATSASPSPSRAPMTDAGFTAAVEAARQRIGVLNCDSGTFRSQLQAGLGTVSSSGPVAKAMLAQLEVSLTGRLGSTPAARSLTPSDDLAAALAQSPEGSTLTLAAGTYRLTDTLVLLRGVTLQGAGRDRTVLTGAPADASLLVLTDKAVALRGLTVKRDSATAGSGVVTGAVSALTLRDVRVTGAASAADGRGGAGVLLSATEGAAPATRTTTLDVADSRFDGNATAGIAVGGWHRTRISKAAFDGNRQCGVCFLGVADGVVSDSDFHGNATGVAAAGDSHPVIRADRFVGGKIAVQASDSSAPTVIGNHITSVTSAAMLYLGQASGTIDANTCPSGQVGIAVAKTAYPYVATNSCTVTVVH